MLYRPLLLFLLLLVTGCAKLGYLTEQGYNQFVKIQWKGRDNQEVLDDPKVPEQYKHKILLVGEYKKFFYHYFDSKPTSIYSKTTMLENKAVSYLVIATPHTSLDPHQFKFPFVGSFPYIGFFNKDSAMEYARELEKDENLVTWVRPVYAYSTLGYLEDRILSSFFHYDDVELAELVFHELFHTIFFIKNEVDLNENMANLYGKELLKEYFKDRPELKQYLQTQKKIGMLNKRIVELIDVLKDEFAKLGAFITDEKADVLTRRFVTEVFIPEVKSYCEKIEIAPEDCKVKENYNQASFAAFMTYEEEQDFLERLMQEKKLNLRELLSWLREQHKLYEKDEKYKSFTDYLKAQVTYATVVAD